MGYSLWGHKGSDIVEHTTAIATTKQCISGLVFHLENFWLQEENETLSGLSTK